MSNEKITIYQFNVGNGDHSLIEFKNNRFGIIDFYNCKDISISVPPALSYFEYLLNGNPDIVITISFICITHYDIDHIRGLSEMISLIEKYQGRIQLERIYLPDFNDPNYWERIHNSISEFEKKCSDSDKRKYRQTFEKVRKSQILKDLNRFIKKFEESDKNNIVDYLSTGKGSTNINDCKLICISPMSKDIHKFDLKKDVDIAKSFLKVFEKEDAEYEKYNENSLSTVFLLEYGDTILFFGGDINEKKLIKNLDYIDREYKGSFKSYKSNYIKAPHHGSKTSSSKIMWEKIIDFEGGTVISFSSGEKYKHPHPNTIRHIKEVNSNECEQIQILATKSCFKWLRSQSCENNCLNVEKCLGRLRYIPWYDLGGNSIIKDINTKEAINYEQVNCLVNNNNEILTKNMGKNDYFIQGINEETQEISRSNNFLLSHVVSYDRNKKSSISHGITNKITGYDSCNFKTKDGYYFK